jgi:hypothetical protein
VSGHGWWGGVCNRTTRYPHRPSDLPYGPYVAAALAVGEIYLHARLPRHVARRRSMRLGLLGPDPGRAARTRRTHRPRRPGPIRYRAGRCRCRRQHVGPCAVGHARPDRRRGARRRRPQGCHHDQPQPLPRVRLVQPGIAEGAGGRPHRQRRHDRVAPAPRPVRRPRRHPDYAGLRGRHQPRPAGPAAVTRR